MRAALVGRIVAIDIIFSGAMVADSKGKAVMLPLIKADEIAGTPVGTPVTLSLAKADDTIPELRLMVLLFSARTAVIEANFEERAAIPAEIDAISGDMKVVELVDEIDSELVVEVVADETDSELVDVADDLDSELVEDDLDLELVEDGLDLESVELLDGLDSELVTLADDLDSESVALADSLFELRMLEILVEAEEEPARADASEVGSIEPVRVAIIELKA